MKESEAWVVVAEEYDAGREKVEYLCLALGSNGFYHNTAIETIPWELRTRMIARIKDAVIPRPDGLSSTPSAYGVYSDTPIEDYPSDVEQKQGRITACLLFSAIAEDEESGNGSAG